MKLLVRYLGFTVVRVTTIVLLVFVSVLLLILFLSELRYLGKGDYSLALMIWVVVLKLPTLLYQLFPMAAFLGCQMGLGLLAAHSELLVMRAAGLSLRELVFTIMKTSVMMVLMMTLLGEVLGPYAMRLAQHHKLQALSAGKVLKAREGAWLKAQDDFIHVGQVQGEKILKEVTIYRFDGQHHLTQAIQAQTAVYQAPHWLLSEVKTTKFFANKTQVLQQKQEQLKLSLNPSALQFLHWQSQAMDLSSLWHYIQFQRQNQLLIKAERLNFWRRVWQPLASVIMILLAVPFVLGPLRSSSTGLRLFVGICLGFCFYFSNQLLGSLSLISELPPSLAALLPSLLFASLGLGLLYWRRHQ